jgi:hypothetical protein
MAPCDDVRVIIRWPLRGGPAMGAKVSNSAARALLVAEACEKVNASDGRVPYCQIVYTIKCPHRADGFLQHSIRDCDDRQLPHRHVRF